MGTFRALTMIAAALSAGLALAVLTARAEPQSKPAANAPLLLTPAAKQAKTTQPAKTPQHVTKVKKPRRAAKRSAPSNNVAGGDGDRNIMRGSNTVSLIARLPWWRSEELETIRYRQKEVESQVLSATDAWFEAHGTTVADRDYALASADDLNAADPAAEEVQIADANEINAIDLAALEEQPAQSQSWLRIILATLGGALAAASTVRFLFV